MRVGVDARLLVTGRGIGNVLRSLLWELGEIARDHRFVLFSPEPLPPSALPPGPFENKVIGPGFFPIYEQLALPGAAREVDVLYCPANTGPVRGSTPLVLHVHDLIFLQDIADPAGMRTAYQRLGRVYSRRVVPRAVRRARVVLTISEFSKGDIETRLGVSGVRVAPNALPEAVEPGETGIDGPYTLALGASDPRKNIDLLLRAWTDVPGRLVIAGCQPSAEAVFAAKARELGIADRVTLLGFVEKERLAGLYRDADRFVFPSLTEGFGLPILEALSHGTPVISSNAGPMPEVGGEAAVYFDPHSVESLRTALADPSAAERAREHGAAQVARFSWRSSAQIVLNALEEAAS